MKIIRSTFKTPFLNFALEELLLKGDYIKDEDVLLLYQNENAIIVGKNQNTHEEIDAGFVKNNKIQIARRLSGGGAVYHDMGNVNFCFITKNKPSSYQLFLKPIIGFLKSIGLKAEFAGKNDVLIDGIKISGNAQFKYKGKMFHHGTLLYDTDLSILSQALIPNPLKLQSKSIKSIRQRVSNIKELLEKKIDVENFVNELMNYFEKTGAEVISQDIVNIEDIKQLAEKKSSDDWNFGLNPSFDLEINKRFKGGTIKLKLSNEKNKITQIKIEGDFLSNNNFESIYNYFINQKFDIANIKNILKSIDNFQDYFGTITKDEIISMFEGLKNE